MPFVTLVVLRTTAAPEPSFTLLLTRGNKVDVNAPRVYVGVGVVEVSLISTSIDSPVLSRVNVIVSRPSVRLSSIALIIINELLLLTVKLPVRDTSISLLSTPVIV